MRGHAMVRALAIVCALAIAAHAAPASRALDETLEDDELADARADGLAVDDGGPEPPAAARLAGGPPIAAVIAAAYAAAGVDADPAHGWLRRARLSGLVPWVTLRGARVTTWSDPAADIGHSTTYEVRATWRLDRLLYDGRELQIAGAQAARRRERRRIASRVIRSYFTWQRARAAAVRHPTWSSHADEAAAELDALTDGWFGESLAARPGRRPAAGQVVPP